MDDLVADPNDCTKFFERDPYDTSILHHRSCYSNLVFNQTTQKCDFRTEKDCLETEITTQPSWSGETCQNRKSYPHPTNVCKYFFCSKGVLEEHACDVNSYFNAESAKCEPAENVICEDDLTETTVLEIEPTIPTTIASITTVDPTNDEPITVEPTTIEPTTIELTTIEPTTEVHTTVEPTTEQPTTVVHITAEPTPPFDGKKTF